MHTKSIPRELTRSGVRSVLGVITCFPTHPLTIVRNLFISEGYAQGWYSITTAPCCNSKIKLVNSQPRHQDQFCKSACESLITTPSNLSQELFFLRKLTCCQSSIYIKNNFQQACKIRSKYLLASV